MNRSDRGEPNAETASYVLLSRKCQLCSSVLSAAQALLDTPVWDSFRDPADATALCERVRSLAAEIALFGSDALGVAFEELRRRAEELVAEVRWIQANSRAGFGGAVDPSYVLGHQAVREAFARSITAFVTAARTEVGAVGATQTVEEGHRLADMPEFLLVATTTPDPESASRLAASAVTARLAATAQVTGPAASFFWHLGEQGQGEEWNVTFKTTGARYDALETHIVENHPCSKPEVTAIELVRGSAAYFKWLQESTIES